MRWVTHFRYARKYVGDQTYDQKPAIEWHRTFREEEAIRLCLKHFRQKNYTHVFDSLLKGSNVQLEDPRLTKLHEAIVVHGDYELTENLIESAIQGIRKQLLKLLTCFIYENFSSLH